MHWMGVGHELLVSVLSAVLFGVVMTALGGLIFRKDLPTLLRHKKI
jgi:hypothetical protein